MQCSRCDNTDPRYFYRGTRGLYCRRCIKFGDVKLPEISSKIVDSEYQLKFELTERQKEVSARLTEMVSQGRSVLLEAVCGAGKTEIIFEMVSDQLKRGRKVGFTIARRQVVLEIAERLSRAFTNLSVIPVCQGHTDVTMADLVVCTTHQLFRYNDYFDVLIIDAYGIIGLNSKGSANKGFLKLSPILFSPQMRLMIDLRRKHAQNEDLSAKRSAACNFGSTVSDVVPSHLLQRQSAEHTPDVDLHRSTVRYSKDVSFACAA